MVLLYPRYISGAILLTRSSRSQIMKYMLFMADTSRPGKLMGAEKSGIISRRLSRRIYNYDS